MTALQKPTQESVVASIVRVQYHHWEDTQFVSCLVERDDGFHAHGFHNPIDPADFNLEESQRLAYAGAVATLYGLAVSGFFERRAMLAGAQDVLDRCGVSGDDLAKVPAEAPRVVPAVGAEVIMRVQKDSGTFRAGTELAGVVTRTTAKAPKEPGAQFGVAITVWMPKPVEGEAYVLARDWSEVELVDRPMTNAEKAQVAAISKRLAEEYRAERSRHAQR